MYTGIWQVQNYRSWSQFFASENDVKRPKIIKTWFRNAITACAKETRCFSYFLSVNELPSPAKVLKPFVSLVAPFSSFRIFCLWMEAQMKRKCANNLPFSNSRKINHVTFVFIYLFGFYCCKYFLVGSLDVTLELGWILSSFSSYLLHVWRQFLVMMSTKVK